MTGIALLLLTGPATVPADEPKGEPAATIDAQDMNFDRPNNMAYAKGDVVIHYQDVVLRADKARYNTSTRDVWAEGNVRLNRNGQEWVAPALQYNFDTRELKADQVRGFFDPLFVTAGHVSLVGSNHYTAPTATLTTCDYEEPHYHIKASHAEIYPDDRIVLFNCSLWLGEVPVFWLPVATFSLKDDSKPLSLTIGHSSRWGYYALTTTTLQLNRQVELALHLDERTERGLGEGADVKYRFGDVGEGLLRGYYLNDADARNTSDPNAGKGLPTSRWLGEWKNKSVFPDDITLTLDLNKQSDQDVVRDFFPDDYRRDREPTSVIDVTKRGDNYTLSAFARPQFNSVFDEVERLPEVSLAINRTKIGPTPVYYESQSSVGYYNNYAASTNIVPFDPLFTGSTMRADTFHQLVSPQMLFGWLSFVPRAGGRYTFYERAPDSAPETSDVSRYVASLGAETSVKLTRTWRDVQNKRLDIDGLRHIVEPFANYQWVPTPNVLSNNLFQFDTVRSTVVTTNIHVNAAHTVVKTNIETLVDSRYLPLEFPAFNDIDAIDRVDTLRFGLRQRLQTRRDGRPWDLLALTGWTDWHIEKTSGENQFSDLFGTMEVRPSDWIVLNTFSRYDPHDGVVRELNNDVRVSDADQWSVGVGTRYLKDDSNLVSASVTWRLARNWVASVYQRVDMQDGQWEEQDYVLRQETHDWFITYGFRYSSNQTTSDDKSIYVSVTLKAFPGVKLSANQIDFGAGN